MTARPPFWAQALEAMDLDATAEQHAHGKAHHTPVSEAPDAPHQREKQARLPDSVGRTMAPEEVAAIEALTGMPIRAATETVGLSSEVTSLTQRRAIGFYTWLSNIRCQQLPRQKRTDGGRSQNLLPLL